MALIIAERIPLVNTALPKAFFIFPDKKFRIGMISYFFISGSKFHFRILIPRKVLFFLCLSFRIVMSESFFSVLSYHAISDIILKTNEGSFRGNFSRFLFMGAVGILVISAVFKTVAGHNRMSRVGSIPTCSRQKKGR